jgi:hypothetical protein
MELSFEIEPRKNQTGKMARWLQPEGLSEISRGLSAATPPENDMANIRTLKGCQKHRQLARFCDPSGVVERYRPWSGGIVADSSTPG